MVELMRPTEVSRVVGLKERYVDSLSQAGFTQKNILLGQLATGRPAETFSMDERTVLGVKTVKGLETRRQRYFDIAGKGGDVSGYTNRQLKMLGGKTGVAAIGEYIKMVDRYAEDKYAEERGLEDFRAVSSGNDLVSYKMEKAREFEREVVDEVVKRPADLNGEMSDVLNKIAEEKKKENEVDGNEESGGGPVEAGEIRDVEARIPEAKNVGGEGPVSIGESDKVVVNGVTLILGVDIGKEGTPLTDKAKEAYMKASGQNGVRAGEIRDMTSAIPGVGESDEVVEEEDQGPVGVSDELVEDAGRVEIEVESSPKVDVEEITFEDQKREETSGNVPPIIFGDEGQKKPDEKKETEEDYKNSWMYKAGFWLGRQTRRLLDFLGPKGREERRLEREKREAKRNLDEEKEKQLKDKREEREIRMSRKGSVDSMNAVQRAMGLARLNEVAKETLQMEEEEMKGLEAFVGVRVVDLVGISEEDFEVVIRRVAEIETVENTVKKKDFLSRVKSFFGIGG